MINPLRPRVAVPRRSRLLRFADSHCTRASGDPLLQLAGRPPYARDSDPDWKGEPTLSHGAVDVAGSQTDAPFDLGASEKTIRLPCFDIHEHTLPKLGTAVNDSERLTIGD